MRSIMVFLDMEIFNREVGKTVKNILKVLDTNDIKAAFNIPGLVVKEHPEDIKKIAKKGHEIACHGYSHENFFQLNASKTNKILDKTESIFNKILGKRPIGIRCPYHRKSEITYSILLKRGYKWTSNENVPYPEVFDSPYYDNNFLSKLVNKMYFNLRRVGYKNYPFKHQGILEIPALSSSDGQLLGIVSQFQESPENWLEYALNSLKFQFDRSEYYFNLNFHVWLIGSSNRITLLEDILDYIKKRDVEFKLPKEMI